MRPSLLTRCLLFAGVAVLAFAAFAACGDDDDDGAPDPTTPPVITPTPTTPSEPVTPTTPANPDLARIQPAIDAITSGDAAKIKALIAYTPVPCKDNVQGFPQPPKCEGKPEGTKVEVFPASSCEGQYLTPSGVDQLLSGLKPTELSGAFKKKGAEANPEYPDGRYGVIVKWEDGSGWGSYWGLNEDGKVVRYWHGCGSTPGQVAGALLKDGTWVLAPN